MSHSKLSGQSVADIAALLRCPTTHQAVTADQDGGVHIAETTVPVVAEQPVLVDFDNSILDRTALLAAKAESLIPERRRTRPLWKRVVLGQNRATPASARQMLDILTPQTSRPVILIVGGGTLSDGSEVLYEARGAQIISFDVYASPYTDFVADAHAIPLQDQSVEAVWIEAVLEHVLSPHEVAEEIWRVLKPKGLVYAGTPFLQPVHEQAYDFTRFTQNGHRWLFRKFECIDSGVTAGPGTALFQMLRYAMGAVFSNRKIGSLVAAPFFWLRFIDRLSNAAHGSDAASGVYFLGQRAETALRPGDMPRQFKGVTR